MTNRAKCGHLATLDAVRAVISYNPKDGTWGWRFSLGGPKVIAAILDLKPEDNIQYEPRPADANDEAALQLVGAATARLFHKKGLR